MFSIPFDIAEKILYSIDCLVEENEEETLDALQDIIGDMDSYNSLSVEQWMEISNFLKERGKFKDI